MDGVTELARHIRADDVWYIIESTSHSFKNGWHYNSMSLKKFA